MMRVLTVLLASAAFPLAASAGPLLDNFKSRMPTDVRLSYDTPEVDGGVERLGRLVIEGADGTLVRMSNAALSDRSGGMFLSGDTVLLSAEDGMASAISISVGTPLVAWFFADQTSTIPIHSAIELEGLTIDMNDTALGGGEKLSADRLAFGRAQGGEVMALLAEKIGIEAPGGQTMSIGALRANFPVLADALSWQAVRRLGIEADQVQATGSDQIEIFSLEALALRLRSDKNLEFGPTARTAAGRAGELYNALTSADLVVQAELSGLDLPVHNLLPDEFKPALDAVPGGAVRGDLSVQLRFSAAEMTVAIEQRLEGLFDFALDLGAGLKPIPAERLAALDAGEGPEITDFPEISIGAFRVGYQSKGIDQILVALGLEGAKGLVMTAADPLLARAGSAATAARPLIEAVGAWFERGRTEPVCVVADIDQSARLSLAEIAVIAVLSPDLAVQQLKLSDTGC